METRPSRRPPALLLGVTAFVVLAALAVLYRIADPARSAWMPQCLFRQLTGWECPACGGQRALHSLLHGHVAQAIHFNLFLVVAVPYLAAVVWTSVDRRPLAARIRPYVQHRWVGIGYCVLFVVWWVVRNLPGVHL